MPRLDARAYWAPGNRWLCGATVGLTLLAGVGLLGPGASYRSALHESFELERTRFERWQADFKGYRPITRVEAEGWEHRYAKLVAWLPEAADEPSRIAEIARWFEAPSARDFQVQPGEPLEDRDAGVEPSVTLYAANDARALQVTALPLQVSFKLSYPDMRQILRRLQAKELPVLVESLRVRRSFDEVEVRIDLIVLLRAGVTQ